MDKVQNQKITWIKCVSTIPVQHVIENVSNFHKLQQMGTVKVLRLLKVNKL